MTIFDNKNVVTTRRKSNGESKTSVNGEETIRVIAGTSTAKKPTNTTLCILTGRCILSIIETWTLKIESEPELARGCTPSVIINVLLRYVIKQVCTFIDNHWHSTVEYLSACDINSFVLHIVLPELPILAVQPVYRIRQPS